MCTHVVCLPVFDVKSAHTKEAAASSLEVPEAIHIASESLSEGETFESHDSFLF